jgi:hypothetical protein
MRIKPLFFGILILTAFLGTILAFQTAGIWSISGKTTGSGEAVQPSADDVNTIKGWMTLDQITTVYHISLADLLSEFNLPADTPASTAIKDLESELFSVTNLRDWLFRRMQPTQPESTTVPVEQVIPTPVVVTTEPATALLPTEHVAADKTVTGKTTFQELLDWGVPEDAIRQVIDDDLPAPTTVIKDFVTSKGLDFPTIKAALQAEVDKSR